MLQPASALPISSSIYKNKRFAKKEEPPILAVLI